MIGKHLLNGMILQVRVNKELLKFDEKQTPQPPVYAGNPVHVCNFGGYLVSWSTTYVQDLQPTCKGVIIHLLSTMDIPEPPIDLKRAQLRQRSLFPAPPFFGLVGCGFVWLKFQVDD